MCGALNRYVAEDGLGLVMSSHSAYQINHHLFFNLGKCAIDHVKLTPNNEYPKAPRCVAGLPTSPRKNRASSPTCSSPRQTASSSNAPNTTYPSSSRTATRRTSTILPMLCCACAMRSSTWMVAASCGTRALRRIT